MRSACSATSIADRTPVGGERDEDELAARAKRRQDDIGVALGAAYERRLAFGERARQPGRPFGELVSQQRPCHIGGAVDVVSGEARRAARVQIDEHRPVAAEGVVDVGEQPLGDLAGLVQRLEVTRQLRQRAEVVAAPPELAFVDRRETGRHEGDQPEDRDLCTDEPVVAVSEAQPSPAEDVQHSILLGVERAQQQERAEEGELEAGAERGQQGDGHELQQQERLQRTAESSRAERGPREIHRVAHHDEPEDPARSPARRSPGQLDDQHRAHVGAAHREHERAGGAARLRQCLPRREHGGGREHAEDAQHRHPLAQRDEVARGVRGSQRPAHRRIRADGR